MDKFLVDGNTLTRNDISSGIDSQFTRNHSRTILLILFLLTAFPHLAETETIKDFCGGFLRALIIKKEPSTTVGA